jgi:nicotinamidase/pyrazinamidase
MQDVSRRSLLATAGGLSLASLMGSALAQCKIKPGPDTALVVVDVQNCFLPGGSLAVAKGDEIIPLINRIAKSFQNVVLTQDWHTPGHISFASSHLGKNPFESIKLPYGNQILWPDHCVQGTEGAAINKGLDIPHAQLVIRKGYNPKVDSYSAFIEADGKLKTPTAISGGAASSIFVTTLTDFCVAWSATDARKLGLDAYVIEDACRGIDTQGSLAAAWTNMQKAGVKRIQSTDLALGV